MGLGILVTSHFLVNEEWSPLPLRITHLAWKIQTTLVETNQHSLHDIMFMVDYILLMLALNVH